MNDKIKIPYFDLTEQFAQIKAQWFEEIEKSGRVGNFILGEAVERFEADFAQYLGAKHAVSVSSGTDALALALKVAGVNHDDSVIVPNFTFFASVEAISLVGARPKLVDIGTDSYQIDPEKISEAMDGSVKAIIPVHLFGQSANLEQILQVAHQYEVPVIEDTAQAFGCRYKNQYCGTIGELGCFSFYPTKIIGAYGDGGMVTTDSDQFAEDLKLARNHGTVGPNQHAIVGTTSRLDAIQANLLRIKLESIEGSICRRRALASRYIELLTDTTLVLPEDDPHNTHVYNIFTVRSSHRNRIVAALRASDAGFQIYYPTPVHKQQPYQHLGYTDDQFPQAMQACNEVISFPLYPEMPESHVDRICEIVRKAIS